MYVSVSTVVVQLASSLILPDDTFIASLAVTTSSEYALLSSTIQTVRTSAVA